MSKVRAKSQKRHQRRREAQANPTKGRSNAEHNKVLNGCKRFSANLGRLLDATGYQTPEPNWFPYEHIITDREDEFMRDWRYIVESAHPDEPYRTDNDGLLLNLQESAPRASNNIDCVVVFKAPRLEGGYQQYMLRRPIFSPFKCDEWGKLPLSLHQWRVIALTIIQAQVLWQWTGALNHYSSEHEQSGEYELDYIVGWYLGKATKPSNMRKDEDKQLWTGPIIYSLATMGNFPQSLTSGYLK